MKKYIFIIIGFFIATTVSSEVVLAKWNTVISMGEATVVEAEWEHFYKKGEIDKYLGWISRDSNQQNIFLFSNGNKVIYTPEEGAKKLFVYDSKTDIIFNLVPTEYKEDIMWDIQYYNLKQSPSKKFVFVKTSYGGKPAYNFVICDLDKIEKAIEQVSVTEFSEKTIYLADYYPDLDQLCVQPHSKSEAYRFSWNADNTYSFHTPLDFSDWLHTERYKETQILPFYVERVFKGDPVTGEKYEMNTDPPPPWPDVDSDDPDYAMVLRAKEEGWLDTKEGEELNLDEPVSFGEVAKMTLKELLELKDEDFIPPVRAEEFPCPKVPLNHPVSGVIMMVKEVISGRDKFKNIESIVFDLACKPDEPATRLEGLALMLQSQIIAPGSLDCSDRWPDYEDRSLPYAPYASFIKQNNLLGEDIKELQSDVLLTKRQLLKAIDRMSGTSSAAGVGRQIIPCVLGQYPTDLSEFPDSAVSRALHRQVLKRQIMLWGGSVLGGVLVFGAVGYVLRKKIRPSKKKK